MLFRSLEKILGECSGKSPGEILPTVKQDIDKFVGNAPQFDDITMICMEYRGKNSAPPEAGSSAAAERAEKG